MYPCIRSCWRISTQTPRTTCVPGSSTPGLSRSEFCSGWSRTCRHRYTSPAGALKPRKECRNPRMLESIILARCAICREVWSYSQTIFIQSTVSDDLNCLQIVCYLEFFSLAFRGFCKSVYWSTYTATSRHWSWRSNQRGLKAK